MNPYFLAAILAMGFASGWAVHGWKMDSENSAVKEASEETARIVSKTLEDKLAELRANERTTIREIQTIIERPIYSNECIDSDGLLRINAAKAGAAKPADSVP